MQRRIPGVMRLLSALLAAVGLGQASDVHVDKGGAPRVSAPRQRRSAIPSRMYAAARRRTNAKMIAKRRAKGLTRAARKRARSA